MVPVDGARAAPERRGIALVGHLDTVRTRERPPPRSEGGRIFAPGAADMKGGLAV